jgi:predicted O-methyltransferase YrrM
MIELICKILKKLLPNFLYLKLKKIYNIIIFENYDLSKDLNYNESVFKLLKFDIEKIKSQLNLLKFQYHPTSLSWHYHLFVGLKDYFGNKKIDILEIGTFNGNFSNFISKLYDESHITTIDLDESDNQFINTYGREEKEKLDEFLKLRNKNLNRKNINFIKLNSLNIKKYFKQKKFDLIWVDGDHLNPQVTIDIINSLDLLNNDGIICIDDVIMDNKYKKGKYVSNEGFFTLKHLEDNGLIKNYYLIKRVKKIKRVRKKNANLKKYVSVSIFKDNPNMTL